MKAMGKMSVETTKMGNGQNGLTKGVLTSVRWLFIS